MADPRLTRLPGSEPAVLSPPWLASLQHKRALSFRLLHLQYHCHSGWPDLLQASIAAEPFARRTHRCWDHHSAFGRSRIILAS